MFNNKINYRLINFTAFMLLLYIAVSNINIWAMALKEIIKLILPFLIAFVFAYAFYPLVTFLEKKKIKKGFAVTIVVLVIIAIIASLLTTVLPLIYDQLISLSKILGDVVNDLSNKYNLNIAGFEVQLSVYLNNMIKGIGKIVSEGSIDIVSKTISYLATFLIGFITWIYFLADMDSIRKGFSHFLKSFSNRSYLYFKSLDKELGNYLHGLSIFMIIQLFEYALVFKIVGHPNWLLLGILASVTTVIPYFGGLITNIIAVITASVISSKLFVGTVMICLIFPQLDGYLISPKVYGKTNNVNALVTIIAVSIGGSIGGIVGIMLALPVYLAIRNTYYFFKKDLQSIPKKIKENN